MKSLRKLLVLFVFFGLSATTCLAQSPTTLISTEEAQLATAAAELAPSPTPIESLASDITAPSTPQRSRLTQLLLDQPATQLSPLTALRHVMRWSVEAGVPANLLVLVLLFPLITALLAASRHIIGLEGFGLFTPALLGVSLISTGIFTGLLLFAVILSVALIARALLRGSKLPYLPRTSLIMWGVSLAVFAVLLSSPYLQIIGLDLFSLTIFPLLVLVLLSENFLSALLSGSQRKAIQLTLETSILAVISAILLQWPWLQETALLNPEITLLLIFLLNISISRYTGLRLTEFTRFRPLFDPEE